MFLENLIVYHIMETSTRLSHAVLAKSRSVAESIEHFEGFWVSQNDYVKTLMNGQAFINDEMKNYSERVGWKCYKSFVEGQNNVLESKHRVLRDIRNR